MKVIDLLNKIANGEQPKKIKYDDDIYEFDCYEGSWGYVNKEYSRYKCFANEIDCDLQEQLNDEIEIIEEDKKIEKLVFNKDQDGDILVNGVSLIEKVNEIIDKVNKEK